MDDTVEDAVAIADETAIESKIHTRTAKELWKWTVYRVICLSIKKRITKYQRSKKANTLPKITYLEWRLGFNLYKSGRYEKAIVYLESTCCGDKLGRNIDDDQFVHPDSDVHLAAARCCVGLYNESKTRDHDYLKRAYQHYQNAIDKMHSFLSIVQLPSVLFEFSRMLEEYGAFQAAADLYTRILSNFLSYRGYFDVLYRSAIVGKHISSMSDNPVEQIELLSKATQNLLFLLEALPTHINEAHILFLYAKCLEDSADNSMRFTCKGIYKTLFDICRDAEISIADANGVESFQEWFTLPNTWYLLGAYLMSTNEPLLAKESYSLFEIRLEQKRESHQEIEELLGIDACLKIASTYARFQNYSNALKYAEYAFKLNHFHPETRRILSNSSEFYREKLERENRVFKRVQELWRQRAWTSELIGRMKKQALEGLEKRYSEDPYNLTTRGLLAYYARGKFRAQFLFEVVCAMRIQRAYRSRRFVLLWLKVLTAMYKIDATIVVGKFKKTPYDWVVRSDFRRIARHRLCPVKHFIHKILNVLNQQDTAAYMLRRVYRTYQLKRMIYDRIKVRRNILNNLQYQCAIFIQCNLRCKLARLKIKSQKVHRVEVTKSAVVIQRYVRWRNSTFQHAVTRIMVIRRRQKLSAQRTFIFILKFVLRRYFERRREKKRLKLLWEEEEMRKVIIAEYREYLGVCSVKISRLLRRYEMLKLMSLSVRCYSYRGRHELSMGNKGYISGSGGSGGYVFFNPFPSGVRGNNNSNNSSNNNNNTITNITSGTINNIKRSNISNTKNDINSNNNNNNGDYDIDCNYDISNQLPKIPHTGFPRIIPHQPETRDTREIRDVRETRTLPLFKGPNNTISGQNNMNNPLFKSILLQKSVYYSHTFTTQDCLFLSAALTHPCCEIEHLIFHDIIILDHRYFENDLLTAIKSCRSLREIKILHGNYSSTFILNLLQIIQIENPRIIGLFIEGIDRIIAKSMSYDLSISAGRLLCDYFNYSLPGVRTLSLHNTYLQDSHLSLLSQGLEINTALQELTLSRNLITDLGLFSLFSSISKNQKSGIRVLNLSCNFITCKGRVRGLFEGYRSPVGLKLDTQVLEIWLADNMVKKTSNISYLHGGLLQLKVNYREKKKEIGTKPNGNTNGSINGNGSTNGKIRIKNSTKFSTLKGFDSGMGGMGDTWGTEGGVEDEKEKDRNEDSIPTL